MVRRGLRRAISRSRLATTARVLFEVVTGVQTISLQRTSEIVRKRGKIIRPMPDCGNRKSLTRSFDPRRTAPPFAPARKIVRSHRSVMNGTSLRPVHRTNGALLLSSSCWRARTCSGPPPANQQVSRPVICGQRSLPRVEIDQQNSAHGRRAKALSAARGATHVAGLIAINAALRCGRRAAKCIAIAAPTA